MEYEEGQLVCLIEVLQPSGMVGGMVVSDHKGKIDSMESMIHSTKGFTQTLAGFLKLHQAIWVTIHGEAIEDFYIPEDSPMAERANEDGSINFGPFNAWMRLAMLIKGDAFGEDGEEE